MVFSRPIRSETQPKKGRVAPFATRSMVRASGSAAMPNTVVAGPMPNPLAKTAICEMTIRPPVPTMVIIRNSSQNAGVANICAGL